MKLYIRCTALQHSGKSSLKEEVFVVSRVSEFVKRLAFTTDPDSSDIDRDALREVRKLVREGKTFDCQCFLDAAKKSPDNWFYKLYDVHTARNTIVCPVEVKYLCEKFTKFKDRAWDDAEHNWDGIDYSIYDKLLGLFKLASAYEDGFVTFTQFYKL